MLTLLGAGQGQNLAPSLSFDWLNTNSLTSAEGYPLTFTRASQATYWGSDGLLKTATTNEARFEYDPNTLVKRGLKIEPQATNLLLRSEDYANAYWLKTDITASLTTETLGIRGNVNEATKIQEGSAGTAILQSGSISVASSTRYCLYYIIKKGAGNDWVRVRHTDGGSNGANCWFNINTGVAGSISTIGTGNNYTSGVIQLNNSYVVIWASGITGSNTSLIGQILSASGNGQTNRAPNCYYYLNCSQLELGSFPTSYIQTTTATATRSADVDTMSTGAWYNSVKGSVLTEYMSNYLGATDTATVVSMNDGTANNRILLRSNNGAGSQQMLVTSGGTEQANITASGISTLTAYKTAIGFNANDFAIVSNNGTIATDTSGTVPTVNTLRLGSNVGTTESINGWLRSFKYYNQKLPNAQLKALTA